MALAVWGFYWPAPYTLCVAFLALAPIVALGVVRLSDGEVLLGNEGGLERETLGFLFYGPAGVLGYRAFIDGAFLDWMPALWAAAALGSLVCLLALRWGFGSWTAPVMTGTVAISLIYGWGVVVEANALIGRPTVQHLSADVAKRRDTGGSDASYYLTLASPRYPGVPAEVEVPRSLHDRHQVGDKVCTYIYRGALSWRWYEVDACPS